MRTERQQRAKRYRRRFSIDDLTASFPAKANSLLKLHVHFQDKTFLPTLHDVNVFLYRQGAKATLRRSRSSALADVFNVLANLAETELRQVLAEVRMRASGKSDLEIVADAILRRNGE